MSDAPASRRTPPERFGDLPALAGGSPESDGEHSLPSPQRAHPGTAPEVAFVAAIAGAATLFFGIVPQPLFELVRHTGSALGLL
jgi:hypothetical protein